LLPLLGLWLLLYGGYAVPPLSPSLSLLPSPPLPPLRRPLLPDGPGTLHADVARDIVADRNWAAVFHGLPVETPSRVLETAIAVSFKLFGVADWSARLPIALSVLALTVVVFFFARRLFAWNSAALYAALLVVTWPGTFLATRDLSPIPFFALETTIVIFILWHLLIVKRLKGGLAITTTAVACLLMLLTASWPAMVLPLAFAVACWDARRRHNPARLNQWPLMVWAISSLFFAGILEAPHNPLLWISPLPPLALLLGEWLARNEPFAIRPLGRRIAKYVFAAGLVVSLIAIVFAIFGRLLFGFARSSIVTTTGATRIPLFIFAAAVIAGVTGNLIFRLRNRHRLANCFIAGMLAGITVAIQAGLILASPNFSSQILADAIRAELSIDDVIVIDGTYSSASSFAFYLNRPILLALPKLASSSRFAPAPPPGMVAVDTVWSQDKRVFLWTSSDHPLPVPGQSYVVAASGGKEILSNQPNSGGAAF
jgi:hypothetical protein